MSSFKGVSKYKVDTTYRQISHPYFSKTGEPNVGKANGDKYDYDIFCNEETDRTVFKETDEDIFLVKRDDDDNYVAEYIGNGLSDEELCDILNGDDYDSSSKKDYSNADEVDSKYHKPGTGSTQDRVDSLDDTGAYSNGKKPWANFLLYDDDDNLIGVDRDKIDKDLKKKGLDDKGYNVDDVLELWSYLSNGNRDGLELFFHNLANEAYLGADDAASANNPVNGILSKKESNNFFEQREFNEAKLSAITSSNTNAWKQSNEDAGSDVHDRFSLQDVKDFYNLFNKSYSTSSSSSKSSKSSSSYSNYDYEDKTISSSNLDTASEVKNVLTNLQNTGDFEANFSLDSKLSVYNSSGTKVSVPKGDYEITKITSTYIEIENEDGKTYKLKRGTSSGYFEYASAGNIDDMTYSADKKISSSSTSKSSSSYSDKYGGTYNNHSLGNMSSLSSQTSSIKNTFDKLEEADDFDLTLTIKNKNWFDEDGHTLVPVGEYQITKVTSSYVILRDDDGETYKIPRYDYDKKGYEEYTFEWYCSRRSTNTSTTYLDGDYEN